MANANTPRGLVPVRGVNGQYVSGGLRSYVHADTDATPLYKGDPVKLTGTNYTVLGQSLPGVTRAATGDVIAGVVVGVLPFTRDSAPYAEASSLRIVMVDDDPNTLFEVQDAATGTNLTPDAVGQNVSFTGTGGNNAYGWSNVTLDNTTAATTATLALKIVDVVNREDVDPSATGPLRFLVRINRHQYANQVAGV